MFTFRAEYHYFSTKDTGPVPPEYHVTNAVSYEVRNLTESQCGMSSAQSERGSEDPRYKYPQKQVTLLDSSQNFPDGRTLFVGHGANFSTIYVMNEAGRTIDTIRVP